MGNMDKSLCVALLAIWSCTRLLRRLACLPSRSARGVWFLMFINQHGDTFPEDGTTAEELQNPMPKACDAMPGAMMGLIMTSSPGQYKLSEMLSGKSSGEREMWKTELGGKCRGGARRLPASTQEAPCSQWSTTSVLKDAAFLVRTESWWGFGLARASSGVKE